MGRPPGSINKQTYRVDLTCLSRNFSTIDNLIDAAEICLQTFVEEMELVRSGRMSPMESKADVFMDQYIKINAHISKFLFPTRKAIEHKANDPTQGMSPEQKLEAMKQAVAMLELQVKKSDGSGSL